MSIMKKMEDFLNELQNKICTGKNESILNKLNLEYALFYISKKKEFSLIRSTGIFQNKSIIEELENNYHLWEEVFKKKIYKFNYKNILYIVMIDNPNDIKFCLFIKSSWFINQLELQSLYLIFLMEIENINHSYNHIPDWYKELLWDNIHKRSPIMILSEIGSLEDLFIETFTHIKTGRTDNTILFETLNLDEKVQMYELFGDDPGERLKTERIMPLLDVHSDIIIIKEITFLSLEVQKKLLFYFLENKEKMKQSLWIFTSNYDIEKMVKYNQFQKDFWEFLKLNIIYLPPLRKVGDQLMNEVQRYINYLSNTYRKKIKISQEAINKIISYEWPGNLEEFYLTLESAFILCTDDTINDKDIVLGLWSINEKKDLNLRKNIENLEKKFIFKAYRLLGGNQVHMANTLGISRGSLQYKLQKYGIKMYD